MYACLGVTCHLHFWQIDRGLLRATAVTREWNGHRIRVSTQSWLWRRRFSRRSCRDSNSQAFDHESGALANKLSRLPVRLKYVNSRENDTFCEFDLFSTTISKFLDFCVLSTYQGHLKTNHTFKTYQYQFTHRGHQTISQKIAHNYGHSTSTANKTKSNSLKRTWLQAFWKKIKK